MDNVNEHREVSQQPRPEVLRSTPPVAEQAGLLARLAALVKKYKFISSCLLGLVLIPYFTFQAMEERVEKERTRQTLLLDEEFPVKLTWNRLDRFGELTFLDGSIQPCQALGVELLRRDEYQSRSWSSRVPLGDTIFPVVVYFNGSGFDVGGVPERIVRATDGHVLYERLNRPFPVRYLVPRHDGKLTVVFDNGTTKTVTPEEWVRDFVNHPFP